MKNLTKINLILVLTLFVSCSSTVLPIDELQSNLKALNSYTILLEDMKEEGFVSTTYYHKYRVVSPDGGYVTPWFKVSEKYYRLNSGFLGMALVTKKDGKVSSEVSPPGYQYVGDSRYGHWRQDSYGRSFWEFYGKYALIRDLMGGWYRPVYRYDYRSYRDYSSRHMVFYGGDHRYGSNGRVARSVKPSFFERRREREMSFSRKFKNSFNEKVGRTKKSVFRGKAGRIGK